MGGALLTLMYQMPDGFLATATFPLTTAIAGSAALSSGSVLPGMNGSSIVSVTRTGITAGEASSIGMKLVRAFAY